MDSWYHHRETWNTQARVQKGAKSLCMPGCLMSCIRTMVHITGICLANAERQMDPSTHSGKLQPRGLHLVTAGERR